MFIDGDSAYIVGDDASGIYKLSLNSYKFRKINFLTGDTLLFRIPKPVKHDFESALTVRMDNTTYLLAFGSGSLSPSRDTLLMMDLNNETNQVKIPLAGFYKTLSENFSLKKEDLNMEGATVSGNDLYLFNRGNNMIFKINWAEFYDYARNASSNPFPAISNFTVELPIVAGVQAGFSGACTLDKKRILFTATLEDTKNWVEDGEILGSYIGVLELGDPQPRVTQTFPVKSGNETVKVKLESLDILSVSKNEIAIECIADNDDGSSAFYRLHLVLSN